MKYIKTYEYINTNAPETFFFTQDGDSHWHMIPTKLKDRWNELMKRSESEDDYEADDLINNEFGQYRTGGGISNISFENPQKF